VGKLKMASVQGSIIVFAKCPIAGSSKTRLSSLLGDEGAARLARAMLSDILTSISEDIRLCQCNKVLVYAPGNLDGDLIMKAVLVELGLTYASLDNQNDATLSQKNTSTQSDNEQEIVKGSPWILLPMASVASSEKTQSDLEEEFDTLGNPTSSLPVNSHDIIIDATDDEREHTMSIMKSQESNVRLDLQSSDLGSKLADALEKVRQMQPKDPVVFLGMDSPELPLDEIALAMTLAASDEVGKAYINPAHDGGYGMLCVPKHATSNIFKGIRWSSSLTAVSQMKALSDNGVDTIVGSLMNDIDDTDDLKYVAIRMSMLHTQANNGQSKIPTFEDDRLLCRSEVQPKINKVGEEGELSNHPVELNDAQCLHTFQALQELGLVHKRKRKQRFIYTINGSKWD